MKKQIKLIAARLAIYSLMIGIVLQPKGSVRGQGCAVANCATPTNVLSINTPNELIVPIHNSVVIEVVSSIQNPSCPIPLSLQPTKLTYVFTLFTPSSVEVSPPGEQRHLILITQQTGIVTTSGYGQWTVYPHALGDYELAVLVSVFLDECLISTRWGKAKLLVRDAINQTAQQADRFNTATQIIAAAGAAIAALVATINKIWEFVQSFRNKNGVSNAPKPKKRNPPKTRIKGGKHKLA